MDYWFWINETNFNLIEQIHVAQFQDLSSDTNVDMETVTNLHNQFVNKSFPEHRSPWCITLIENVPRSTKTVLSLKHTLLKKFKMKL